MKLGLNVYERGLTVQILSKCEGNVMSLRMVRDIVSKVGCSAAEHEEFGITYKNGGTFWNPKGNLPVDLEFADAEIALIKQEFDRLDKMRKLNLDLLAIYEKLGGT